MSVCGYRDEHLARCPQRARVTGLCFYHEKVDAGVSLRTFDYLSDTEVDTLFTGRRRNDGRRLDHYTK